MENYKRLPAMDFAESVSKVLNNMFKFDGRSRRSELWWYYLAYMLATMLVNLLLTKYFIVENIIGTILQLSLWSVTVRRLHDRGHNGWWVIVAIIVNIFIKFYVYFSGYYEIISAVNPDLNAAMETLNNPIFLCASLISFIVNITILIFCILDGKPEPNKYGISPKYVPDDGLN